MRINLNTSAWNRPFDDQSAERVRMEAEAVVGILSVAEARRIDLVGSEYLDFEVGQNPDRERALRVAELVRLVRVKASSLERAPSRHGARVAWAEGLSAIMFAPASRFGGAGLEGVHGLFVSFEEAFPRG